MDYEFLDFNYHGKPDLLHVRIQEIIDHSQGYVMGRKRLLILLKCCMVIIIKRFLSLHWERKTSTNTEKKFARLLTFFGWDVGEEEGDLHLLADLLNGSTVQDAVYVEPGRTVTVDMLAGGELCK